MWAASSLFSFSQVVNLDFIWSSLHCILSSLIPEDVSKSPFPFSFYIRFSTMAFMLWTLTVTLGLGTTGTGRFGSTHNLSHARNCMSPGLYENTAHNFYF